MSTLANKNSFAKRIAKWIKRRFTRSRSDILESIVSIKLPEHASTRLIAPPRMQSILNDARSNGDLLLVTAIEDAWVRLCRMLDNKNYFDICPIDSIIALCDVRTNNATKAVYKNLHALHCREYSDMDENLIEMLPEYLNNVFSEGRMPVGK